MGKIFDGVSEIFRKYGYLEALIMHMH